MSEIVVIVKIATFKKDIHVCILGGSNKMDLKKTEKQSDDAYKFLYNFCIDHTKDQEERQEFFKNLSNYLEAEIELEREVGK